MCTASAAIKRVAYSSMTTDLSFTIASTGVPRQGQDRGAVVSGGGGNIKGVAGGASGGRIGIKPRDDAPVIRGSTPRALVP